VRGLPRVRGRTCGNWTLRERIRCDFRDQSRSFLRTRLCQCPFSTNFRIIKRRGQLGSGLTSWLMLPSQACGWTISMGFIFGSFPPRADKSHSDVPSGLIRGQDSHHVLDSGRALACLHTRKNHAFGSICLPRFFGFRPHLHLGKTQPASRSRFVLRQSRSSSKRPTDGSLNSISRSATYTANRREGASAPLARS